MSDNFNSDELNPPTWMDNAFFENVLKKCENSNEITLNNVEIAPATAKGDHFASIMFRAVVSYTCRTETKSKSMIIKTMPQEEGFKQDVLKESFIFETEIGMYSKTIPQFQEELRKIGDNTVLGVKALYWSLEPHKVIVLEDISPKGYTVLRDRMANMEESKSAILKLAKWHAVSYKLSKEGDKDVCSYREAFFNKKGIEDVPFVTSGITNFIEQLETVDSLKKFVPHLKKIEKSLLKRCIDSFNAYRQESPKGIFVLGHGDFHAKNIMVKRNENGEFEDVMLIDFQTCSFIPAVLDLGYGLHLLCEPHIRLEHYDELVYFYCSNFIKTLKMLKFDGHVPTISDFYIDILRHCHNDVFLITSFVPIMYGLVIEKTVDDTNTVLELDEERKKVYSIPSYLRDVEQTLPRMFYRGYLE